jgi:hypothetical protein
MGYSGGGSGIVEYLADKQVLPLYASCIVMTVVMGMRYLKFLPWNFCIIIKLLAGCYLLVQASARSVALIYIGTSVLMFFYVYQPKMLKWIFTNKLVTLGILIVVAISLNALYMISAKNGLLGEEGYKKYESKISRNSSFMDNRADFLINLPFLMKSPFVGAGSEFRDSWGIVDKSDYVEHFDAAGRYINHDKFFGHSCIVGAWTANGIFGLIFWLYVLWLMFNFFKSDVFILGDLGPFVIFAIIGMIWAILFSPFGGFRAKVMFIVAFLTLSHDVRFKDWIEWSICKRFSNNYYH